MKFAKILVLCSFLVAAMGCGKPGAAECEKATKCVTAYLAAMEASVPEGPAREQMAAGFKTSAESYKSAINAALENGNGEQVCTQTLSGIATALGAANQEVPADCK